MRSIVVSSSERTSVFSDVRSERRSPPCAGAARPPWQPSASASSSRVGRRPCSAVNSSHGLLDVALPAADRARGPVLAAQLVEHGAVDAGPRVLLERRALLGVVAVDRPDQRLEAAGDEVLHLAAGRHLADLLVDDVLHQRGEGEHQAIAQGGSFVSLVLLPECERCPRRTVACVDAAVVDIGGSSCGGGRAGGRGPIGGWPRASIPLMGSTGRRVCASSEVGNRRPSGAGRSARVSPCETPRCRPSSRGAHAHHGAPSAAAAPATGTTPLPRRPPPAARAASCSARARSAALAARDVAGYCALFAEAADDRGRPPPPPGPPARCSRSASRAAGRARAVWPRDLRRRRRRADRAARGRAARARSSSTSPASPSTSSASSPPPSASSRPPRRLDPDLPHVASNLDRARAPPPRARPAPPLAAAVPAALRDLAPRAKRVAAARPAGRGPHAEPVHDRQGRGGDARRAASPPSATPSTRSSSSTPARPTARGEIARELRRQASSTSSGPAPSATRATSPSTPPPATGSCSSTPTRSSSTATAERLRALTGQHLARGLLPPRDEPHRRRWRTAPPSRTTRCACSATAPSTASRAASTSRSPSTCRPSCPSASRSPTSASTTSATSAPSATRRRSRAATSSCSSARSPRASTPRSSHSTSAPSTPPRATTTRALDEFEPRGSASAATGSIAQLRLRARRSPAASCARCATTGDLDEAPPRGDEVLALFPGFTDVLLEQAIAAATLGDHATAIAQLERCLELGDAPSDVLRDRRAAARTWRCSRLADVHRNSGDLDAAEELLAPLPAPSTPSSSAPSSRYAACCSRAAPRRRTSSPPLEARVAELHAVRALHARRRAVRGAARPSAEEQLAPSSRRSPAPRPRASRSARRSCRRRASRRPPRPRARSSPTRRWAPAAARTARVRRARRRRRRRARPTRWPRPAARRAARRRAPRARGLGARRSPATSRAGELPAEAARRSRSSMLEALAARSRRSSLRARCCRSLEALALAQRERRELLARMYLRRGFLESAGDEWVAASRGARPRRRRARRASPQVAAARGLDEDAALRRGGALASTRRHDRPRGARAPRGGSEDATTRHSLRADLNVKRMPPHR